MRPVPVYAEMKLLRQFRKHADNGGFYTTHAQTEHLSAFREVTALGYVFAEPEYSLTPLFRWYNGATGKHLFTSNDSERPAGYVKEGIEGYVFRPDAAPEHAVPLRRWINRGNGSHLLSTSDTPPEAGFTLESHAETALIYPYSAARWMERLDGSRDLRQFTLPGTHDSATYLTSMIDAQCQQLSLVRQLEEGVRFLDARLYIPSMGRENTLKFCHGIVTLDLYYDAALNICADFLARNPSETIVLSIKQEFSGPGFVKPANYDEKFETLVWQDLESHARNRFHDGRRIPLLDEVRGKIVILRRFDAPRQAHRGIDASGALWPSNSTTTRTNTDNVTLRIQDEFRYYTSLNINRKFNDYMRPVLDEARTSPNSPAQFINFASGTGAGVPLGESPANIAINTNTLLGEYLRQHPQGRYGIVPLDFPELGSSGLPLLTWLICTNPLRGPSYYAL